MGCNCFGTSCGEVNIKETLESSDVVLIQDRGRTRAVDAQFFLSKLVTDINTSGLDITLTFADGSTKTATVVP